MLYGRCCLPMGKGKLWPPPEQKPSNRSRPNLASVITSQGSPNVPSLVDVTSPDAARRRGGLSRLCDFFPTFFLFFSQARAQPRRKVRSSSLMAETIRSGARKCLFYKNVRKSFIFGVQSPKNGVIFRRIGIFQLKRKIDRAP
jgi:hypothetical protein